jgi:hypothetical protein
MRLYHVVVIVTDPKMKNCGETVFMTRSPVTHDQGCIILSKLTRYPWRNETLLEITQC